MPRAEFGTAPFCGGSAASSAVMSGAATADIGAVATRARKIAAEAGAKEYLCIEILTRPICGMTLTDLEDLGQRRPPSPMMV